MKKFGIIYIATNTVNNKNYIGKTTKSLKERMSTHFYKSKRNKTRFYFSIRKHGFCKFNWNILCECYNEYELNEKEKHYIKEFDSFKYGYNMTLGGEGTAGASHPMFNKKISKETIDKIKKSLVGKNLGNDNHFFGKKHNDKTKDKISVNRKGKNIGDENHKTIINNEIAFKIKGMLNNGIKCSKISKILDINLYFIYNIKYDKTWKHVKI